MEQDIKDIKVLLGYMLRATPLTDADWLLKEETIKRLGIIRK